MAQARKRAKSSKDLLMGDPLTSLPDKSRQEQDMEELQAFLMDISGDLESLDDELLSIEFSDYEAKSENPSPLADESHDDSHPQITVPSPPFAEEYQGSAALSPSIDHANERSQSAQDCASATGDIGRPPAHDHQPSRETLKSKKPARKRRSEENEQPQQPVGDPSSQPSHDVGAPSGDEHARSEATKATAKRARSKRSTVAKRSKSNSSDSSRYSGALSKRRRKDNGTASSKRPTRTRAAKDTRSAAEGSDSDNEIAVLLGLDASQGTDEEDLQDDDYPTNKRSKLRRKRSAKSTSAESTLSHKSAELRSVKPRSQETEQKATETGEGTRVDYAERERTHLGRTHDVVATEELGSASPADTIMTVEERTVSDVSQALTTATTQRNRIASLDDEVSPIQMQTSMPPPTLASSSANQVASLPTGASLLIFQDWDCPCGTAGNYASRSTCRTCHQARPSSVSSKELPRVGDVVRGVVLLSSCRGIAIDLGASSSVRIPPREVGDQPPVPGDYVFVKILFLANRRGAMEIVGSLREVDAKTGASLPAIPALGSIHQGKVVCSYRGGFFISITGYSKQGFVRFSPVLLALGQLVQVIVTQIRERHGTVEYALRLIQDKASELSSSPTGSCNPCVSLQAAAPRVGSDITVVPATEQCKCGAVTSSNYRFCPNCGQVITASIAPAQGQSQMQQTLSDAVFSITLETLEKARLDRATLIKYYTNCINLFDTVVSGFLVRVSDVGGKYDIGRIVGCQNDEPYQHQVMGSVTCSKILLVKVCCEPEPKTYPLYMVSSQPFKQEELIAYQIRVAINPAETLISPSECEQRNKVKCIMHNLLPSCSSSC